MVTLTYPGNWRKVCPDGATLKRHLKAQLQWFRDTYAAELPGGELRGAWKLEFQPRLRRPALERKAPHFHLLLPLPVTDPDIRRRLSASWARIVGATGEDRRRHELAGTGLDWTEGARSASDPKRMAIYFLKHSAPGTDGTKEAQHEVPADFNPGRFWSILGKRPAQVEVELPRDTYLNARRALRSISARRTGYDPESGARVPRPPKVTQVAARSVRWRAPQAATRLPDGTVWLRETGPDSLPLPRRKRKVTRRKRILSAGYSTVGTAAGANAVDSLVPGGWILANDGLRLGLGLVEAFATPDLALQLVNLLPNFPQRSLSAGPMADPVLAHSPA